MSTMLAKTDYSQLQLKPAVLRTVCQLVAVALVQGLEARRTGQAVDIHSQAALARAVLRLCTSDRSGRATLAQNRAGIT